MNTYVEKFKALPKERKVAIGIVVALVVFALLMHVMFTEIGADPNPPYGAPPQPIFWIWSVSKNLNSFNGSVILGMCSGGADRWPFGYGLPANRPPPRDFALQRSPLALEPRYVPTTLQ